MSLALIVILSWCLLIGLLAAALVMADMGGPRDPRVTRTAAPAPCTPQAGGQCLTGKDADAAYSARADSTGGLLAP